MYQSAVRRYLALVIGLVALFATIATPASASQTRSEDIARLVERMAGPTTSSTAPAPGFTGVSFETNGVKPVVQGSNLIYRNVYPCTSVIQRTLDGSVQTLLLIECSEAPEVFPFHYDNLPVGGRLEQGPAGMILAHAPDNNVVGVLSPPWANDASKSIPTHYLMKETGPDFQQVVRHIGANTTYPVMADPRFFQKPWGYDILFNRSETNDIMYAAGTVGVAVGFLPFPLNLAAIKYGHLVAHANWLYNRNECIGITVYPNGWIHSWGHRGGLCR